jgi:hypothetical protein
VTAAKEAIEERVRQAFQLRSSSQFDPNLNKRGLKFDNRMIESSQPIHSSLSPFDSKVFGTPHTYSNACNLFDHKVVQNQQNMTYNPFSLF